MKWKPAEENSSYKFIDRKYFHLYNLTVISQNKDNYFLIMRIKNEKHRIR